MFFDCDSLDWFERISSAKFDLLKFPLFGMAHGNKFVHQERCFIVRHGGWVVSMWVSGSADRKSYYHFSKNVFAKFIWLNGYFTSRGIRVK